MTPRFTEDLSSKTQTLWADNLTFFRMQIFLQVNDLYFLASNSFFRILIMYYFSTRNNQLHKTLSEAIISGLAADGGLFIPDHFPKINIHHFSKELTYPEFATEVLRPYFENDRLESHLNLICNNAFTFPLPLKQLNDTDFVLELFHGPTLSFKDVGARFLAESLEILDQKMTILVATSGDTGSAVASAFYRKKNINVIILYPKGKISVRQEHQITCWGENVLALAVNGTFDDCQRLVKQAFQDPWWNEHYHLSSANSINIGRLLPQATYYAYHSLRFYREHQAAPGFIIPTGNLGHATAAYWAKMMGFPIREIVVSTNANQTIPDYLKTGEFKPRPSVSTLANAMDVGNPSNFERLAFLYPLFDEFKRNVKSVSASDEDIKKMIKKTYHDNGIIICPHTATAFFAREQFAAAPWIMVSTADPCKFEEVIEPLIGRSVPIAPSMQIMLDTPAIQKIVNPDLHDIQTVVMQLLH
jgi:threonine synthase